MKAGRELDALIAEKVMGLNVRDFRKTGKSPYYSWWGKFANIHFADNNEPYIATGVEKAGCPEVIHISHYSTDIASAWEVVEKTGLLNKYVLGECDGGWAIQYLTYSDLAVYAQADTVPLAICLAALKTVNP